MTPLDPSTDPDLIQADTDGMIDRRDDVCAYHDTHAECVAEGARIAAEAEKHHPVNTDPPKPAGPPQEPTTRAEALAQAKEWGSTLSHWNSYCGTMGDRDMELQLCAQHDLQEQQRLLLLAQILPEQIASQDEADSGIEEDTRFNPNALRETEQEYMALARSCSDARLEEHLAEHGFANLRIGELRSLGARCLIAARRKGGSR